MNKNVSIWLQIIFLLSVESASAQFLIENNNADVKSKMMVKTEIGYYNMPDSSLCLMWIKEFNKDGLLTKYQDFWLCGQPYWTYTYEYDSSGVCVRSFISSYKDSFKTIELRHIYNQDRKLIKRTATDSTRYPTIEYLTYDQKGNVTNIRFDQNSKEESNIPLEKTWNGDNSYLLTKVEAVYDMNNNIKWEVKREFRFY